MCCRPTGCFPNLAPGRAARPCPTRPRRAVQGIGDRVACRALAPRGGETRRAASREPSTAGSGAPADRNPLTASTSSGRKGDGTGREPPPLLCLIRSFMPRRAPHPKSNSNPAGGAGSPRAVAASDPCPRARRVRSVTGARFAVGNERARRSSTATFLESGLEPSFSTSGGSGLCLPYLSSGARGANATRGLPQRQCVLKNGIRPRLPRQTKSAAPPPL